MLAPWGKSYDKPRQCIKKQKHHFADKGQYSQSYGFSIVMYGCESWTIKKPKCRRIDAFELWCWRRLLRVLWTARRSNQSILKEVTSIFIERTDAEAPIVRPPDARSQLIGKDLDVGRDWGQEKVAMEDEMVGWHHQLKGHDFEQTQGHGGGQGSLMFYSTRGCKVRHDWVTKQQQMMPPLKPLKKGIWMLPGWWAYGGAGRMTGLERKRSSMPPLSPALCTSSIQLFLSCVPS